MSTTSKSWTSNNENCDILVRLKCSFAHICVYTRFFTRWCDRKLHSSKLNWCYLLSPCIVMYSRSLANATKLLSPIHKWIGVYMYICICVKRRWWCMQERILSHWLLHVLWICEHNGPNYNWKTQRPYKT